METLSQKAWENVTQGLKVARFWTVRQEVSGLHILALDAGTEVPKNPFHCVTSTSSRRQKVILHYLFTSILIILLKFYILSFKKVY